MAKSGHIYDWSANKIRWGHNNQKPTREVAVYLFVNPLTGFAASELQKDCGILAFSKENGDFSCKLFWQVLGLLNQFWNRFVIFKLVNNPSKFTLTSSI